MANIKKFFSRIQPMYRPSQTAVKAVVALLLVLCIVGLVTVRLCIQHRQAEVDALHEKAAEMSATNDELKEDISQLGSVESALEIAQEELGMVQPDTIIFDPAS